MKAAGAIGIVALCFSVFSTSSFADTSGKWDVWVEQDGNRIPVSSEVRLKRKPFAFVFSGDRRLGYAVVGAVEKSDLENLKTDADFAKVIRPTNIRAEYADRSDRELLVLVKGAIPSEDNACQVWSEDPKKKIFNFQSFEADRQGVAMARREIRAVDLYTNYKEERQIPVEKLEISNLYVLITGLPPVGRMTYTEPKLISIAFPNDRPPRIGAAGPLPGQP